MARTLRWQIPFKSLNETSCEVLIYAEGWTGGVTTLTGAANPFVFDEDDSDSLIEPIRIKSGTLRVIEQNYNDLADLHPLTNTDHFVRVTYNSISVFTGYMMAQSFETKWEAGPRVLEFPVTSPLGIADGLRFDVPSQPSYITIAAALKQVATKLNASINHIIFPDYMLSETVEALSWEMNTLSICPFNDDYTPNPYDTTAIYKPKTLRYFIEALCNCFGLIVHDTPDNLVFSRFDYDGTYNRYVVSSMDAITPTFASLTTGATAQDLSGVSIKSADNMEKCVMPVSEVVISYDDDFFPTYKPDFTHAKAQYSGIGYAILTPSTDEITSDYLSTSQLPTPNSNTISMCAVGEYNMFGSMEEMFMFSFTSAPQNQQILKWKLYNVPKYFGYGSKFKVGVIFLDSTTHETTIVKGSTVGIIMKNGNYYRLSGGVWSYTSAQYIEYVETDDSGEATIELSQRMPDLTQPLEIILTVGSLIGSSLFAFKNLEISHTDLSFFTYTGRVHKNNYPIKVDNGSNEEASVSQSLTVARLSENCLIHGNSTYLSAIACDYDYMFKTQPKITISTGMITSNLPSLYLKKTTLGDPTKKRVVGYGCDIWNDIFTITAQGSETLNT